MIITVIGKEHREGKSKRTGNDYNMNIIYYNAPARNVDGLAAKEKVLDAKMVSYGSIVVGKRYNIEFDENGYVAAFDACDK